MILSKFPSCCVNNTVKPQECLPMILSQSDTVSNRGVLTVYHNLHRGVLTVYYNPHRGVDDRLSQSLMEVCHNPR